MNLIQKTDITAKNLTTKVLLDTYTVGTITEPYLLRIELMLGKTNGLIQGQGAEYTVYVEKTDTDNEVAEYINAPFIIVSTTETQKRFSFEPIAVTSNEVVNIYALSNNASDTAVLCTSWYWNENQVAISTANQVLLNHLNADISSRMATFSYTPPDNTNIGVAATQATAANEKLPVDTAAKLEYLDMTLSDLFTILDENIDSTGETLSLKKAIETILAVLIGNETYLSGLASFKGRDGSTTIASVNVTDEGTRTDSTIN